MRSLILLVGVAALGITAPALSQGQGRGQDNGKAAERAGSQGKGKDRDRGRDEDRRGPPQDRGNDRDRAERDDDRRGPPAAAERGGDRDERLIARGRDGVEVSKGRPAIVKVDDIRREAERRGKRAWEGDRRVRIVDAGRGPGIRRLRAADDWVSIRRFDEGRYVYAAPAWIEGCPPGLARKNNGCLPPGQAKRIYADYRDPYAEWWGYRSWRPDDRHDWRYDNGYLYGVDQSTNLISAFLPLLGGALFTGNLWPTSYDDYDVPAYYDDYYGYDDSYDYRYADGAIFAVDPQNQAIQGIAGLLTGDPWSIGQQMPTGYDFYNVPPDYRDRYVDGDDAWYRYSDGYVYEVDPTTRLVQQAIELIA